WSGFARVGYCLLLFVFACFGAGPVNDSRHLGLGLASHSWLLDSTRRGGGGHTWQAADTVTSGDPANASAGHTRDRRLYRLWHGLGLERPVVPFCHRAAPDLVLSHRPANNILEPIAVRYLFPGA